MQKPERISAPLAKHQLFTSNDLDEARSIVAAKFCDHRLDRKSRHDTFDAVHHRAEGLRTSLNFIRYGADVEIEPGELGSFYLIQIPIKGTAKVKNGLQDIQTGKGVASVLNPHMHTHMRWHEGCAQLLLQIEASYLTEMAQRLIGCALKAPITFDVAVDNRVAGIAPWVNRLRTCFSLADKDAIFSGHNLNSQMLIEEQLVQDFLAYQPSNVSALIAEASKTANNAHIRKAVQFMRDNMQNPMSIADVAHAVGVTPRSLQLGFKSTFQISPMQYLKSLRFDAARQMIMTRGVDLEIGDICMRTGFAHFGRFSVEYKARYGESPHQTARLN